MLIKFAVPLLAALVSVPTIAAPQVSLTSSISVVKSRQAADGRSVVTYDTPKQVSPGDRLSIGLNWANGSGKAADHFVVTDPIPTGLSFSGNASAGAEVSVDGGKTFAGLDTLSVTDAQGHSRPALSSDVTHIRWTFTKPIAPGEHGQLKFEAVVK